MSRRRPRNDRRMDAAIDHFTPMGYHKADVRSVVNRLLKDVYGKDGWPLLEDGCYYVVQEALFEMQEEQDKLQLQAVQQPQLEDGDGGADDEEDDDEAQTQPQLENGDAGADDGEDEAQQLQGTQQEVADDSGTQQQETAMIETLENAIPIMMVKSEPPPSEMVLAVEQTGEVIPMINPPAPRAASTGTGRTRRPCYGWISDSESDSDYEEYLAHRQQKV